MAKKKQPADLGKQLQAAVGGCGQNLYAVAKASGIDYAVLHRFMNDDRDIKLGTASRLADYFGMSLTPPTKPRANA
jgi:plasmid maintenance system antidote protein VapI